MYIRNLPFRVIVPVCYQMRLNVVFSGLSDNKKTIPCNIAAARDSSSFYLKWLYTT